MTRVWLFDEELMGSFEAEALFVAVVEAMHGESDPHTILE